MILITETAAIVREKLSGRTGSFFRKSRSGATDCNSEKQGRQLIPCISCRPDHTPLVIFLYPQFIKSACPSCSSYRTTLFSAPVQIILSPSLSKNNHQDNNHKQCCSCCNNQRDQRTAVPGLYGQGVHDMEVYGFRNRAPVRIP